MNIKIELKKFLEDKLTEYNKANDEIDFKIAMLGDNEQNEELKDNFWEQGINIENDIEFIASELERFK